MQRTVATLLAASLLASSADAQAATSSAPRMYLAPTEAPAAAPGASASGSGFATVSPAAGETETFDALVEQAGAKFKAKDYAGAVALFERAYAVQAEPAILFNIGRIYEQAQNAEAAIGYYEKFISDESVELKDREKAVTRLQVLRTIVEIREKEKAKTNPKPATDPKPAEPTPVVGPKSGTQPDTGANKPPSGRLLRPIGGVMVGAGAVLIIGGAIAGGLARGQHKSFESAKTLDDREAAAGKGRSLAATADGLFIAGGVVAAVGVVLLVIPAIRKSRAAQALSPLSPHVSPTHVGLGFTHRF